MIEVLRADITTLEVDAIVNAASESFRGGGGVDGAIHLAAGPELLRECRKHPRLPTGEALITPGFELPAKYIVHTVGPIWVGGESGEPKLLAKAYESVLRVARKAGIRTIAFPSISTGIYGYPKSEAARVAVSAMRAHEGEFERIVACVFSAEDETIYKGLLSE